MAAMDERLRMLYARRSIRRFDPRPLPAELIEELLKAAMAAPSANNRQPWQFLVITDPALRAEVAVRHPHASFAKDAGAVFVLFGVPSGELFEQDLCAATENLLIACAGLGLGACWCGMTRSRTPAFHELTGIPAEMRIVSTVCVGYPAEHKDPRTQYDPAKVHWQRYGGPR